MNTQPKFMNLQLKEETRKYKVHKSLIMSNHDEKSTSFETIFDDF